MKKTPLVNALSATLYIALVATTIQYLSKVTKGPDGPLAPVAFLSLLTLSAAIMGYLFAAEPLLLYIDGKKKQAVQFFFQTIGIFAATTILIFLALLSHVFR